jgi:uncharacterized protein
VCNCTQAVFEWDPEKAASNFRKHGIRFADSVSVLEDELALTVADDRNDERRWVSIGADAERVRIISARRATRRERE